MQQFYTYISVIRTSFVIRGAPPYIESYVLCLLSLFYVLRFKNSITLLLKVFMLIPLLPILPVCFIKEKNETRCENYLCAFLFFAVNRAKTADTIIMYQIHN